MGSREAIYSTASLLRNLPKNFHLITPHPLTPGKIYISNLIPCAKGKSLL
ncbi:MAG: hypothetical protein ACI81W_002187 [Saprospiraceae bacterium]|jgi:hypothetical protein